MSLIHDAYQRLYGKSAGPCYLKITGCRLPTYLQVLLCYESNRKKVIPERKGIKYNYSWKYEAVKLVYEEVKIHYKKSGIDMKKFTSFQYDLNKLLDHHKSLVKGSSKGKGIDLDKTMPLWPRNTEKIMKKKLEEPFLSKQEKNVIKSDLMYLQSMKTDRVASYSTLDKAHISRIEKRKLKEGKIISQPSCPSVITSEEDSETPLDDPCSSDLNVASFTELPNKRPHKRVVKTGASLFLPADFIKDDRLVAAVKRIKMTPADLLTIMSVVITIGGGNLNSVNLSYTYIRNHFNKITEEVSSIIRQEWTAPKNLLVHWDDKTDQTLDGTSKEKRLSVSVSGKENKVLGVPSLGKKSLRNIYGKRVCEEVTKLLKDWNCVNNIYGMVFDTTSSNTGRLSGACVTFQKYIGKPIFWLACRHHVLEILIDKVFSCLKIERSKTPEIEVFKTFKNRWNEIWENFDGEIVNLGVTSEILQKYQSLQKLSLLRDDYKELVKLALIYIGIEPSRGITLQRPGAISKARWMSKVIYALKIVLLSKQNLLQTIIETTCLTKLKRFADFCINCYIPWWINCTVASAAPGNDLELINILQQYKSTDELCATSALDAMNRHLWYLVEELVPLCLFDSDTSLSVKAKVADA